MGRLASDGTKIKVHVSRHDLHSIRAMSYDRISTEVARLQQEIRELLAQAKSEDQADDAQHETNHRSDELPDELQRRGSRHCVSGAVSRRASSTVELAWFRKSPPGPRTAREAIRSDRRTRQTPSPPRPSSRSRRTSRESNSSRRRLATPGRDDPRTNRGSNGTFESVRPSTRDAHATDDPSHHVIEPTTVPRRSATVAVSPRSALRRQTSPSTGCSRSLAVTFFRPNGPSVRQARADGLVITPEKLCF